MEKGVICHYIWQHVVKSQDRFHVCCVASSLRLNHIQLSTPKDILIPKDISVPFAELFTNTYHLFTNMSKGPGIHNEFLIFSQHNKKDYTYGEICLRDSEKRIEVMEDRKD